jgi:hypothetical protein
MHDRLQRLRKALRRSIAFTATGLNLPHLRVA